VRFVVLTIFPEFFTSPCEVGLLGKAREKGLFHFETVQLRDYTRDRHRTVDDAPFGGGPGMVMMIEPLVLAIEDIKSLWAIDRTILLSPRGATFRQAMARDLSCLENLLLICGRYEGIDERLVEGGFVDQEISVGDYVLNGGETAALALVETCVRLLPGVVGNEQSVANDSFYAGLLDHPHYTRPREFRGMDVPDVLVSGDHAAVDRWRRSQALKATAARRPDLVAELELSAEDRRLLDS